MSRYLRQIILPLLITALFSSCDTSTTQKGLQVRASGESGEIILVMDTLHKSSPLGEEIQTTFRSLVDGLPRPEPEFTIRYIQPSKFQGILKNATNIVIVMVLDEFTQDSEIVKNYFTKPSIERIKNEPDLYMLSKKDEWATGQEILFLFGQNEEQLIKNMSENRSKIRDHFNNAEKRRVKSSLYRSKELVEVRNSLLEKHQFSIRVPFGWRIEFENENTNFIWLRHPGLDVDRSVWIYYENYTDEKVFDDAISFRDKVTKKYIYDDKERNDTSYVVVERQHIPPVNSRITFNKKYAILSKGLWKTKNLSMGGPYISYMFVDEELGRLYYIDGFVYSPGKPQREFIRELDAMLTTFKTESELKPTS